MNNPDTDEIVNYLSTKFNKIFCDRDFVCCVADDFQFILNNKNKCCVLLFPILGPIYQKAVRYQAKIFDLAVFGLNTGKHKSIAVCHKHHLVKKVVEVEEVMEETCSINSRRKRPERQLYVPPAQRGSRLLRESKDSKKCESKLRKSKSEEIIKLERIIPLKYLLYLITAKPVFINWKYREFLHSDCVFYRLEVKQNIWTIPIYQQELKDIFLDVLYNNTVVWQPSLDVTNSYKKCANSLTYPIINFEPESIEETTIFDRKPILVYSYDKNCLEDYIECFFYKVLCNFNKSDQLLLDLSVFNLPHFMIIKDQTDEYIFVCEEKHNIEKCYELKRIELLNSKTKETRNNYSGTTRVLEISKVKSSDMIKNDINSNREKISAEKLKEKNEHDQEKEIMRKAKENINRKSKPIIKYVDDNNDTLKIGKDDNVNNWEDLFDDEGQLQDELFTEIVQKVGNDVTIVKATEDYSAYTTKPIEEFEHVVELYNFPPTLETHDIIQIFSDINSDAMYIKWVDDTHALLVLGSLSQAQKAVEVDNPLIKARPMSAASGASLSVAYKSDLKPAMKRPQTNLQTARRLITTHLGAKTRISKEQSAKEREDLKTAKEMKRLAKKNEKDAWDGFCK